VTDPTAHAAISEAVAYIRHARRLVPADDPTGGSDSLRAELLDLEDLFEPLNPSDVIVPIPADTSDALDRAAALLDQDAVRTQVPLLIWAALSDMQRRLTS
jgi:ABC-type phosphonate transport system ATPase subunit